MRTEKQNASLSWGFSRARAFALVIGLSTASLAVSSCRVSDDDLHQWARKLSGPKRLIAVLTHDKYPMALRVEAAMTLVTMKPRGGRAVGLLGGDDFEGLLTALANLPADKREQIVVGMVPSLEKGITTPPPADGPDESFPYKDAAFALLTQDNGSLVTQPEARNRLLKALTTWTRTGFEKRFDDTSQLFGMEQVLRLLKAEGVRGLTSLIEPEFRKIDSVAKLIHELGDEETQMEASSRLVNVARFVDSEAWLKQKAPALETANKVSNLKVSERQFQAQLATYQEEELLKVFSAMKSVGKKPASEYLLEYALNDKNPEKRRAASLAALEGNLDRANPAHARAMLDLVASDSTPDSIRDVAARRVGELPRAQVADRLYALFPSNRWQVRWSVASLLLKMSEAKHLAEFMAQLGRVKEMAMSEPLAYGPLLHDLKGGEPETLVQTYARPGQPAPVRLTALAYYYRYGGKADLPKVTAYQADTQKVPPCPEGAEGCEWACSVTEEKAQVSKEVTTVGDFVSYCIVPALSQRDAIAEKTVSQK